MKFLTYLKFSAFFALAVAVFAGCSKEDDIVTPPALAHFTSASSGTYFITGPNVTFKIPVGVTTVSDKDRTINFTVTSPTGAQQGTHYTLASTSVVIPAGKAVDSIEVKGVFNQYTSGRKDTLVFTIQGTDPAAAEYNSTYKLLMRGPCFEGDVDLNTLLGEYKNTNEVFGSSPYGPYTTAITAVTQDNTTKTGTITVANIWDSGWNPITFQLNWSDPANRTVRVSPSPQTSGIGDAGTLSATYAGGQVAVRNHSAGHVGTFSVCGQTLRLELQLGVAGVGYFSQRYTVNMAR